MLKGIRAVRCCRSPFRCWITTAHAIFCANAQAQGLERVEVSDDCATCCAFVCVKVSGLVEPVKVELYLTLHTKPHTLTSWPITSRGANANVCEMCKCENRWGNGKALECEPSVGWSWCCSSLWDQTASVFHGVFSCTWMSRYRCQTQAWINLAAAHMMLMLAYGRCNTVRFSFSKCICLCWGSCKNSQLLNNALKLSIVWMLSHLHLWASLCFWIICL